MKPPAMSSIGPPNLEPVTRSGECPACQEEEHGQNDEQKVDHIGTFGSASLGVSASVFNYVLDLCKEVIRESVRIYTGKFFRRRGEFTSSALRFPLGRSPAAFACDVPWPHPELRRVLF